MNRIKVGLLEVAWCTMSVSLLFECPVFLSSSQLRSLAKLMLERELFSSWKMLSRVFGLLG